MKNNLKCYKLDHIIKMKTLKFLLIIFFIMIISVGTCSAYKLTSSENSHLKREDCTSVLIQVNSNEYISGFRRDSEFSITLYVKQTTINGINAVRECYNTTGYWTHSIIFGNGWYMGMGGSEKPADNNKLEKLGCDIVKENNFNLTTINAIETLIKDWNLYHFLLKSPDGQIITYEKKNNKTKNTRSKLQDNEYVVIPNGPDYYQIGNWTDSTPNVDSVIDLESKDKYGVSRRNIMTYDVKYNEMDKFSDVNVFVSNDNGKASNQSTSGKDSVFFTNNTSNKRISNIFIPYIPKKLFIGHITLFNNLAL